MIPNHVGTQRKVTLNYDSQGCRRILSLDEPALSIRGEHHGNIEAFYTNEKEANYMPQQKPLLDALPALPSNGLRVVSLFAGGGLFDLGVIHAGFNVIWACEWEIAPTVAYASNIGDHIVGPRTKAQKKAGVGDITRIDIADIPDCDVIIGGPSCQSWSVAGKGLGDADTRGQMVWEYLRIIEGKRPKAFMFENVKGIVTKKHRPTFDALIAKFEEIGYNVTWRVVNAWDYGVAQKRERVIVCAVRKDLDFTYEWPASEYETSGYRPVLRDAIGDLPEPGVASAMLNRHGNESKRFDTNASAEYAETNHVAVANHAPETQLPPYIQNVLDGKTSTNFGRGIPVNDGSTAARTLIADYYAIGPNEVYQPPNHTIIESIIVKPNTYTQRNYVADWSKPAKTVTGSRLDHGEIHPGNLAPNRDVANHGIGDYWTPKSDYSYDQANRVMSMDEPCNTIPAHHNSGQPIHPTQKPRRFTVREALRIQSVPDSYVIPPEVSLSAAYRIVGNGLAVRKAYHLAAALASQLIAHSTNRIEVNTTDYANAA